MKWARGNKTWHAHTAPVKERISQKLTPRVTPTTLTGRVTAVVIEVGGDQPRLQVISELQRRHSLPELTAYATIGYSLGRVDLGEFLTIFGGHAWASLELLDGIVRYSNKRGFAVWRHNQPKLKQPIVCVLSFSAGLAVWRLYKQTNKHAYQSERFMNVFRIFRSALLNLKGIWPLTDLILFNTLVQDCSLRRLLEGGSP